MLLLSLLLLLLLVIEGVCQKSKYGWLDTVSVLGGDVGISAAADDCRLRLVLGSFREMI